MRTPVFLHRRHGLNHIVMWFVVGLLALRAFVPTGFMPSVDALRDGRFVMTICSGTGGMRTVVVDADGAPLATLATLADTRASTPAGDGGQDDQSLHLEQCPFGMMGSLVALPSVAPVVMGSATLVQRDVPALRQDALPPMPAQGPPLGSRAPPSYLG